MALTFSFSNAQQLNWVLPANQWNMQSTTLSSSSLPGGSSSTFILSNGAYDANGSLLFYVKDDNIINSSGTSIGTLRPYYVQGAYYPPDGAGGQNQYNFETSGEEVSIVPVPGACKKYYVIYTKGNWVSAGSHVLYAIVDCSSGSATVDYPLENSSVSNTPVGGYSGGWGLAVSKTFNGTDRYLFSGGEFGIARHTISSTGISSGSVISNASDEPTLFSGGSSYYSNQELELSPDQQYLAWGNTNSEKLNILKLNSSYTKVTGAAVAVSMPDIRGIEFNASSTRIYISEPTIGVKYYNISTSIIGNVNNPSNLDNTFLELAKNGRIYGVNSNNRLQSIDEATNDLNPEESSPNVNSNLFHITGVTDRFHLPDQIDGEDYTNIAGDATPTADFSINGSAVSTNCNIPTELFNCSSADMLFNNLSVNGMKYRIVVTKMSSCGNKPVVMHDTGIIPNCPTDLKNLPGGASGTYLANNSGLFRIYFHVYNNCSNHSLTSRFISVSNAPSGATASFNTNVTTKAGQTLTIGSCVVPSNTELTYTDGATSCGGVGGYNFPMEHTSAATPNQVGRLNTIFDLSNVSAGIGSSNYAVTIKTDHWDGSNWISMDSNPNGETITGLSAINLSALVSYDPLSPWFEAFTYPLVTPHGSIYRVTLTVSNECGSYTSSQIVQLNTVQLKSTATVSENTSEISENLLVYPNPANARITFEYLSENENEATITISTVDGRIVDTSSSYINSGQNQLYIDLSNFDAGTYFYSFKIEGETSTGTIIKH